MTVLVRLLSSHQVHAVNIVTTKCSLGKAALYIRDPGPNPNESTLYKIKSVVNVRQTTRAGQQMSRPPAYKTTR